MKKWIWMLCIFFTGCSTIHSIPVEKIQFGRSIDEIKNEIPTAPETKQIPSLAEVALKIMREIYESEGTIISEEEFNEDVKGLQKWTLLTYNNLVPSNCQSCTAGPYWFIFDEKSKLVMHNPGDEQFADFAMYKEAVDMLQMGNAITHKKGVALICDKLKNGLKGNQFLSSVDELCKYKIMMAEKVDRGEISKEEYDYFTAQKLREMMESVRLQRPPSATTFIITPFGQGYIMQGR